MDEKNELGGGALDQAKRIERLYDKVMYELKTNLIYVVVLVLAIALYFGEKSRTKAQEEVNKRLIEDRDSWRELAVKSISRNFNYADLIIQYENFKTTDTTHRANNNGGK